MALSTIAALLAATSVAHAAPNTLPTGGQVTLGQATINQSGTTTTVQQGSNKAAIDWQSFSIGQDAKVNFVQPSSRAVMLNRVIGNDPSQIFGQLNANGQVFIVNPNGVLFAPGAQVNAAGILASTRDLSTADFAAGNYRFAGQGRGTVDNQGSLTAANGGYVLLFGAQVSNSGSIQAPQGDVRLAAADEVTVTLDGSRLAGFTVTQGTLDALAANRGLIRADGGRVYLTAQARDQLTRSAVNNDGVIEANSVATQNGHIVLQGDLISHTGTLSASSGSGTDQAGAIDLAGASILQAGQIHADGEQGSVTLHATQALLQTDAASVTANGRRQAGSVHLDGGNSALLSGTVAANGSTGGDVRVTANTLTLAGAHLSADGTAQGGSLLVGGDAHGASLADSSGGFANAQTTQINTTSTLSAAGQDGKIVVWSDATTRYAGQANTGANGFIEVSGKGDLLYQGSANPGQGGHLLLDPTNIVIGKNAATATDYIELADPNPAANDQHGSGGVIALSNGNIVVASPNDNFGAAKAGAVYLYNGSTGALISALYGSHASDQVGSGGVTALAKGNYVVRSGNWANGSNANAGAVTWGSGSSGVSGVVSASNSLVGSQANDQVGNMGITALGNGNYVVNSTLWANGRNRSAGAVTWGDGSHGVVGVVSDANSLVGTQTNDRVGSDGVIAVGNGNYVVRSTYWANDSKYYAGAVTWGSGTSGVSGVVSAANSLVGSQSNDQVGYGGITALSNGNYVVNSRNWANGSNAKAGAVTWGSGSSGVTGVVSAANSLVGTQANDQVGYGGVIALTKGNYVVSSGGWANGNMAFAGAATWGSGTGGVIGAVSATNSLVGTQAYDQVGANGYITALSNGNYVVRSDGWASSAGAVTWGDGNRGITGAVSATNSLVGSHAFDQVGNGGITALANGNYVVNSRSWKNGNSANAGAVTWGDGTSGVTGAVSATNSLVGVQANDNVGFNGVVVLSNGNYMVASPNWANGSNANAGAVTWGSGASGVIGAVSAANSLVGSQSNDQVGSGGITALSNGNYVVNSRNWANGSNAKAGAVTWGDGGHSVTGEVSAANSLVGAQGNDFVGSGGVTALSNGNYVVRSISWANGGNANAGAVTWGSGSSGVTGVVSVNNSLVGTQANDYVGAGGITLLRNGNYVVSSGNWANGGNANAGAVTWGSGSSGVTGAVSANNSLVSSQAGDWLGNGGVTALSNGNYVVVSPRWANGSNANAGAVTWGSGTSGVKGEVSGNNSLVGSQAGDWLGNGGATALSNGDYVLNSPKRTNNGLAGAGQVLLVKGDRPIREPQEVGYTPDQVATLAKAGTTTTLSATNNITVNDAVTVAGILKLLAGDTITLNAGITSTASGTALVLAGQHFTNNAGSAALSTPNGNWQVWSSDPTADNRGGLTYDFKQYNANYGTSTVLGSGNGFFYSLAPTVTASLTGNVTKTYDSTTSASLSSNNLSSTGAIDGDTVSLSAASAAYADANAGTAKNVTATGIAIDRASNGNAKVYGYGLTTTTATAAVGTVDKATVNVSKVAVDNKVYDGTTTATVSGGTLSGLFGGDTLVLNNSGASFSDKNTGTGKTVTVSGLTLADGNGLASNYLLDSTSVTTTANITPKTLTLAGVTATDKSYDGTTDATLNGTAMLSGVVESDLGQVAMVGTLTGRFADKNAGIGKQVNLAGLTLQAGEGGMASGNYVLDSAQSLTASITPKTISVTATAQGKVYDGSTAATAQLTGNGLIEGDQVRFSSNAAFTDKNAGHGKTVNVSQIAASGADAGNYQLVSTSTTSQADISAKQITVSATGENKVYDGSTAATAKLASTGIIEGDQLSFSGTAAFADKNAGLGKTVNVSGITSSGADAGNYQLASNSATAQADISAKQITVGASSVNKVYDGSTAATAKLTSTGIIEGDQLSFRGTAAFADKNAGLGKTVNVSGITSSGADAGNYQLTSTSATTQADISAKQITVSATGQNKVYDGSTAATTQLASNGVVSGDSVSFSGTATFADKNVARGKSVNVTGISSSGTDAGNYTLANNTATSQADISAKQITVSATGENKVYDGSTAATAQLASNGVVSGDSVSFSGTATFADKNVARGKSVNVTGISSSGTDAGNYTLANNTATSQADISAKQITVSATGENKVYDGSTAATAQLASTGIIEGDQLSFNGTAAFADKNAGLGKTVNVSGISSRGADAGNYQLASTSATAQADISAKQITVGASSVNKVYDGSTAATAKLTSTGIIEGDQLSFSGTAAFADKNAGLGKTVNVSGITSRGADAGNYQLTSTSATTQADIRAKQIAVSATGENKVYDGSTASTVRLASNGVVSGDDVHFNGTATFADKNVARGKSVSVTGIASSGTDAGNYTLANHSATTLADITPKQLDVTLVGTVSKLQDGNANATLGRANYQLTGLVDGESISIGHSNGSYDSWTPGTRKTVRATLSAADFSAATGTLLDNYVLATGPVAAAIGEIKPTGNPAAVNAAVTSNPGMPSGSSVVAGFAAPTSWTGPSATSEAGEATSVGQASKPRKVASLPSTLTAANGVSHHTFSIDDGGLRLPDGVKHDN